MKKGVKNMDENERKNEYGEVDLVDFSSNRETDRIRENERIERERRQRRANQIRKQEILRQKKIAQIKQTVVAWGIVVAIVLAVVFAVVGIVSLFGKDKEEEKTNVGDAVSEEETKLVSDFNKSEGALYGTGVSENLQNLLNDTVSFSDDSEEQIKNTSLLHMYATTYAWNNSLSGIDSVKRAVRDVPMLKNGYVWTTEESKKSDITGTYFYDTHASFIKAVCEICLWEGDTSFLASVDETDAGDNDISKGMTVRQKLEKAVDYYFDSSDPYGGGIRYNDEDGLVYISTSGNDGTPQGNESNIFFTYKFGHLDCYNNLLFCDAMQSLSGLYKLSGDNEMSEKYAIIAQKSKEGINNTFYDDEKKRYIGYIDVNGEKYDLGFTAINLMAQDIGVADGERATAIESWICGERKINTDDKALSKKSGDIYVPFSTVEANDSTWDTLGGKYLLSADASFGSFWLNGGNSMLSSYYSFKTSEDKTKLLSKILDEYSSGKLKKSDEKKITDEPYIFTSLLVSNAVREYFGISTDGKVLCINPLFDLQQNIGIKNVSFAKGNYGVLFNDDKVFVFSDFKATVKIKIGGYESNEKINMILVEDGKIISSEKVKADKLGNVVINKKFGENTYIKLEHITEEK